MSCSSFSGSLTGLAELARFSRIVLWLDTAPAFPAAAAPPTVVLGCVGPRFNYISSIKSYDFSVNYYKSSFNFL